jgi:hypothetical protein
MIIRLLEKFHPEPDSLLREISTYISDEMLASIALQDYGEDQELYLAALRPIRDHGIFPQEMVVYPAEVLELSRHVPIENWSLGLNGYGDFENWKLAFCCAALLRATREPWNYGDGLDTEGTLIGLIQSLHALPVDLHPNAVRFMAWLLLNSEPEGWDSQVCAYGVGLLWFALQPSAPSVPDGALVMLCEWIMRRAEDFFEGKYYRNRPKTLRFLVGGPPPSAWELLGQGLCEMDLSARSSELQEWVNLIGRELAAS